MGPSAPAELPGLGSSIAASLLSLGLVCLAAYLALRWLARRTGGTIGGTGPLRVVARQNLDPRRVVFVVEAAGRCFLVGAGENGMTLLAELELEAVKRDLMPTRTSTSGVMVSRFAGIMDRALGRPKRPAVDDTGIVRPVPGTSEAAAPATKG